ncbi:Coenzyme F420 hydrogenase/dehydrogenase, beta subunit C-terminal domain [Methanothrix sp.]|uniref:Coenzyme F420 hydrogenase/dehydrogenase, beta subunit C-terminal domain n=1 Tax=Methanothrix sp. TaxID=90426 RepID=UPI003BB62951
MTHNNITSVLKDGLCTGCGTCLAVCSSNAIDLILNENQGIYVPSIVSEKCINCGICLSICPGKGMDFSRSNLETSDNMHSSQLIGHYLKIYTGYSIDDEIRYNSSSGGIATQILLSAFNKGIIDHALVTKMNEKKPLEPTSFIAKTATEIIEASKSKYCPVPLNTCLKKILKEEGKYAVVGLPCHLHGIRNLEERNIVLRERIILHIGLFCHHCVSFQFTKFLMDKLNINKEEIKEINYRGKGWPGMMTIKKLDGHEIIIPMSHYWSIPATYLFTPRRCLFCSDATAEFADISLGDAWLKDFKSDKLGTSIIITRKDFSDQLIENMKALNEIEIHQIGENKIIESQYPIIYFKKKSLTARKSIMHIIKGKTPNDISELIPADSLDYLILIYILTHCYISNNKIVLNIFKWLPWTFLLYYKLPYYYLTKNRLSDNYQTKY